MRRKEGRERERGREKKQSFGGPACAERVFGDHVRRKEDIHRDRDIDIDKDIHACVCVCVVIASILNPTSYLPPLLPSFPAYGLKLVLLPLALGAACLEVQGT